MEYKRRGKHWLENRFSPVFLVSGWRTKEREIRSCCLDDAASTIHDLCACEAFTGLLIIFVEYRTRYQEKTPMNKINPSLEFEVWSFVYCAGLRYR
jgi:hypothetical protein